MVGKDDGADEAAEGAINLFNQLWNGTQQIASFLLENGVIATIQKSIFILTSEIGSVIKIVVGTVMGTVMGNTAYRVYVLGKPVSPSTDAVENSSLPAFLGGSDTSTATTDSWFRTQRGEFDGSIDTPTPTDTASASVSTPTNTDSSTQPPTRSNTSGAQSTTSTTSETQAHETRIESPFPETETPGETGIPRETPTPAETTAPDPSTGTLWTETPGETTTAAPASRDPGLGTTPPSNIGQDAFLDVYLFPALDWLLILSVSAVLFAFVAVRWQSYDNP